MLNRKWKAQVNDLIGGWCITEDTPKTPAEGAYTIADFCNEEIAKYIVSLHNSKMEVNDLS